jgi:hypothetical protein
MSLRFLVIRFRDCKISLVILHTGYCMFLELAFCNLCPVRQGYSSPAPWRSSFTIFGRSAAKDLGSSVGLANSVSSTTRPGLADFPQQTRDQGSRQVSRQMFMTQYMQWSGRL